MAHGAEMMLHFQFRTFPYGAEQLNYAFVDIDGVPRRRYREMQETAAVLKQLAPYEKAMMHNEVGIVFDYDAYWALAIKPVNENFRYLAFCNQFYKLLNEMGHTSDVISLDADWSAYKMIVVPSLFVMRESYRQKMKEYVKNGGTLIATFLTSVKNVDNTGYIENLPAGLTDLFGVTVQEVEPVDGRSRSHMKLSLVSGEVTCEDVYWSELLEGSAQMVGTYLEDYKAGCGVIAKNTYGKGTAWYLGTMPEEKTASQLLAEIVQEAGLTPMKIQVPSGCEVVRRELDGKKLYYVFNFNAEPVQAVWQGTLRDVLSREAHENGAKVTQDGFLILQED